MLSQRDGASCAKIFDGFVDSGPSADFSFVLLTSGLRYDDVGGRDLGSGQVAEWLMAADCKSAAPCELRRFESSPVHQKRFRPL